MVIVHGHSNIVWMPYEAANTDITKTLQHQTVRWISASGFPSQQMEPTGTRSSNELQLLCFMVRYLISSLHSDCRMGILPDTQICGLRMRREWQERFPRHRRLVIPTCIMARAWRTCRDACQDR